MKKLFKFQKIMSIVYIIATIAFFFYVLGFMTHMTDLAVLAYPQNKHLKEFHTEAMAFNKLVFYISLVGLVSIVLVFALELRTKVQDLFGLIVTTVPALIVVVGCVIVITTVPGLQQTYADADMSYLWLELVKYQEELAGADYVKNFFFFKAGLPVAIVVAMSTITYLVSVYMNFFKVRGGKNA